MSVTLDRVQQQVVGDRSPLTQQDRETIASVLTWDMCTPVQSSEVITIAIVQGIVQVKLTGGRATMLPVNTFKQILIAQQQGKGADAIARLEPKLKEESALVEVDRVEEIYRVRRGIELIGTFYREGRSWVVEPSGDEPLVGFSTLLAAQSALIQMTTSKYYQGVAA